MSFFKNASNLFWDYHRADYHRQRIILLILQIYQPLFSERTIVNSNIRETTNIARTFRGSLGLHRKTKSHAPRTTFDNAKNKNSVQLYGSTRERVAHTAEAIKENRCGRRAAILLLVFFPQLFRQFARLRAKNKFLRVVGDVSSRGICCAGR